MWRRARSVPQLVALIDEVARRDMGLALPSPPPPLAPPPTPATLAGTVPPSLAEEGWGPL
jgi:hypothetical protein